ncbi:alpha/beta hydrolase [Cohnella sp. JJ-181]|uniref:alpha/beta hydrolase n=1 Tax=Cohnella rhizoplanae TaxID=2974897 RepID=UPI0022FF6B53|nr:alpha/beta hydrolase family protein [Cohnella sp. JJ-181]CAI6086972.1 hypothetical protein COHCIP112018_05265 [Cohnella sp. JJ-181]
MLWWQGHIYSQVLGMSVGVQVLLPAPVYPGAQRTSPQRLHPVLYLLHGLGDDSSAWLRRSSIERLAEARGLAVVMPEVHRSYYTDMKSGPSFWTYLSEELPELIGSCFPVSEEREDTFVAGLSMGGYGAFKWALRRPHRFAAAASLSGALDPVGKYASGPPDYANIFGSREELEGSANDLFALADRLASSGIPHPMLYQCCGAEDVRHLESGRRFRDHCEGRGLSVHYEESPGGHDWNFWEGRLARVLDWMPVSSPLAQA